MIIDTHTHFYDPHRPQGAPWPGPDNGLLYRTVLPEHWRALAAPHGVTGTVVVEASAWLEDNQWILDLAVDDTSIVGLVGHIDPCTEEFGAHLQRFAPHELFCGIRVGGGHFEDIDKDGFAGDMEKLASLDLELDVLGSYAILPGVSELAQRLPQLRIVINHIGSLSIDGGAPDPLWVENMYQAASCAQVYCKVSGLVESTVDKPAPADVAFYTPMLDVLWDAFGADRLVYGSNWPVSDVGGDYAQVFNIVNEYFSAKGEEAREKYFWKNAKAAYKWVDRG
jgi:L-fuconolactonase